MNAFTGVYRKQTDQKVLNRPNNQRHADIPVPPRPVRSSTLYMSAVEVKPQNSTKVLHTGEDITVTITKLNESQEHKVERKVRISRIESVSARKSV